MKSARIWSSLDDSSYSGVTGERGRSSNGGWKDQSSVEHSAMAGPVRPSRLRFVAILSNSNAGNQDSQSPLADPQRPLTSPTCACAKATILLVKAC